VFERWLGANEVIGELSRDVAAVDASEALEKEGERSESS